jgi:hypothetical protein
MHVRFPRGRMDPYVEVFKQFAEEGIRYVIVGVFGINFYARQAGQIITTADCDILVPANFSKGSPTAYEHGIRIASRRRAFAKS